MKKSNITHKLAAYTTAAVVTASSADAFAADFTTLTKNVTTAATGIPNALSFAAYLAGGVFSIAGIAELKKHAENAQQTPMKGGLAKLVGGGALLALPSITQAMQGSVESSGAGTGADTSTMIMDNTSAFQ